jgi:3-oxoacyl-[acyl-carrier protein] reductase
MSCLEIDYSGKNIVVTGGSRGIGRSIVDSFCDSGGKVVILDLDKVSAEQTVEELCSGGKDVSFLPLDVSDHASVRKTLESIIERDGQIDVLVNDAGVTLSRPFAECVEGDWDFVVGINLKGTFNTCNVVFPHMIRRGYGKIVNIASIAGKLGGGFRGTSIYAASKAGVIGLTKGLAREGGPFGINVNAVCPGVIKTSMIESIPDEHKKTILDTTPLRKFGEPHEIGSVVAFLASDLASHITGEIMDVDGGIVKD